MPGCRRECMRSAVSPLEAPQGRRLVGWCGPLRRRLYITLFDQTQRIYLGRPERL